ncbi:hypothetical protein LCGC14_2091080 [marine sediment metagenome]|uniref:Uncharacterized protein n=1 Tax=marine sediment metagenome TaxID=412755 RepID=A0A0F9H9K2_9ZZZZ
MSEVRSQNTGNPVLDSLVNLMAEHNSRANEGVLESIHAILLKLAEQEPGGLRRIPGTQPSVSQPQERKTPAELVAAGH